jgi:hypothetical protein
MKVKFLIFPALMATVLFAQRPATSHTPPTPGQLAASQLTRIARFLKLDSANTSKLTGNASLVGDIETEQSALQANAATLKAAYGTLATDISNSNTSDAAKQESTIEATVNSNFQARIAAAGKVVSALPSVGLSVTLSPAQLAGVAQLLLNGGGGFGRFSASRHLP